MDTPPREVTEMEIFATHLTGSCTYRKEFTPELLHLGAEAVRMA